MNKKILKIVKVILWGLVYTLPIWNYLIAVKANPDITFITIMQKYVAGENVVGTMLNKIFGEFSAVPMFANYNGIVHYFAYYVYVSFIHICMDLLLFLPNTARYIFDKMTGEKDEDTI